MFNLLTQLEDAAVDSAIAFTRYEDVGSNYQRYVVVESACRPDLFSYRHSLHWTKFRGRVYIKLLAVMVLTLNYTTRLL